MMALAAMPSASVALVVARSATSGVCNGIAVAMGIVMGDLVFVATAICGMSALAVTLGSVFAVLKYIGAAYLIWIGLKLLCTKGATELQEPDARHSTLLASFASGLFLTLGDLKAILFYASLFPTLMDVRRLSSIDIAIVVFVTILAVGGIKTTYAFAARAITARLRAQ